MVLFGKKEDDLNALLTDVEDNLQMQLEKKGTFEYF